MKDMIRAIEGERLSPVLVISGKKSADIADGFHRSRSYTDSTVRRRALKPV